MSFKVIVIEIMLPISIAVTAVKLIVMPLIVWGYGRVGRGANW